jgi:uncharacterized membrane protein (UPF0127 family)
MKVNYLIILIAILSIIAGLLIGWKLHRTDMPQSPKITINNREFLIEVADTPEKITQGLSDRPSMAGDRGMLFILGQSNFHTFWMNKMKFDLDFVFINNAQVVGLAENIPFPKEGEQPQTITTGVPFNKVLEINAGKIKEYEIKIGQLVQFP